MAKKTSVRYRGMHLGELDVYGPEDWQNLDRAPSEDDYRKIAGISSIRLLASALDRHKLQYHEAEPDTPWPIVVLREVCAAARGERDPEFEAAVLTDYVRIHGMDQIMALYGADPQEVLEKIGRALADA